MTDRYEAERARRLTLIVAYEQEIAVATRREYAKLLAAISQDVLNGKAPVVAAMTPDPDRDRNQIQSLWSTLSMNIIDVVLKLFKKRFLLTGAAGKLLASASSKFAAGVFERLKGVPNEVYDDLKAIIALSISESWAPERLRTALEAELKPGHPEYEARLESVASRVSRTTAIAAFNAGDQEGWTALAAANVTDGTKTGITKKWLSSHDSRVRPTHVVADDDPVNQAVPLDGWFSVGGFQGLYPGDWTLPPEETVNCRCTALYSTNGDDVPDSVVAAITSTPPVEGQPETQLPNGWRGPIAALDVPTGDKRQLMTPAGGVKTRQYPLSLTQNHVGDPTGYPVIGAVDRVWNGGDGLLYGEGPFDLGGEAGREASRQLAGGYINTVSIDPDMVQAVVHTYDGTGKIVEETGLSQAEAEHFRLSNVPFEMSQLRALRGLAEDDATPIDGENKETGADVTHVLSFKDWRMAGLAMVPIPAYTQARISPIWDYIQGQPTQADAIVAASEPDSPTLRPEAVEFLNQMIPQHEMAARTAQNYLAAARGHDPQVDEVAKNVDNGATLNASVMQALLDAHNDAADPTSTVAGTEAAPAGVGVPGVPGEAGGGQTGNMALVAAVGGQIFHKEFFADPQFTGPTKLTIDDNGHVYGHIREHGTCYQYGGGQGDGGYCVQPPPSDCGYAKFMCHQAKMDDGSFMDVGALTFGEGHESRGSLLASKRHYNDVATMAAKGVVGSDEFGIWFSGEVLDAYADQAYDLLLSPMSGHWEPDADNRGHLELMAIHVVVTPGYTVRPIIASFDDEGHTTSLIITNPPVKEASVSDKSARALVAAAMADLKRAEKLMSRIGRNEPVTQTEDDMYAIVSAVTGSSSLPVADVGHAWDGGGAGGRMLDRATTNGKINVAKASQGFLWRDGDGSKRGDYKFPFADVLGGTLTIIPRGVSAAAGRLNQAQGVDQGAVGRKICALYSKIKKSNPSWPDCPVGK